MTAPAATTSFSPILHRVVAEVPGALGAIFADREGEAVDQTGTLPKEDLLLYSAHFGVILNQVQSWLHLFHFGEAVELVLQLERMDVVVRPVAHGYYVVLCARGGAHLATALRAVDRAVRALAEEMG